MRLSRRCSHRVQPSNGRTNDTNEHQVEGTVNKVAGRVQDAACALTGDADQQTKGKARVAANDMAAMAGGFIERLRDWAADQPLCAVVITAGAAFLLGRLTANRD
jgi:uncharacterized protein YjbJ (UPF0337 family)